MSLKLKALSLGLLAAVALSSVLVANAGATRSGHFTSDSTTSNTTTIVGQESMSDFAHKIEFGSTDLGEIAEPIYCTNASFHGTITTLTAEEIRVKPTYSECTTTNGDGTPVHVDFNNCSFKFTSRSTGDATAGLVCANAGESVTLTDTETGCVIHFFPQTVANAVTYDTTTENNKHAITLNATGSGITYSTHSGICIFIATNHTDGTLKGGATVQGKDLAGNFVNITAT